MEAAALASATVLGQLGALTALWLTHSYLEEGDLDSEGWAAFLDMLGAHPSLRLLRTELSFLSWVKSHGLEPHLSERLRQRGWACIEGIGSPYDGYNVAMCAPGLHVQL